MTANTKPNSSVTPNTPTAPQTADAAGKKPTIKMSSAGNALTALHALASSYRGLMDLEKDLRIQGIDHLKAFTNQAWEKAYDAAKDSKHALFMQAGASLVGGVVGVGGAAVNGLTSGTEKATQAKAARNQDYLKGLKTKMQDDNLNLVGQGGQRAGQDNFAQADGNTKEALNLLKEGNYAELRNRRNLPATSPFHISEDQLSDAAKFARAGADGANHINIIKNLDDRIGHWSNKELVASNSITQQQNLNKNLVDLAQGVQQGGFNIQQAKDTEQSRQKEADATKTSQSQKMSDQYQSDLEAERQATARDLRSISEQIGRIVPQRG